MEIDIIIRKIDDTYVHLEFSSESIARELSEHFTFEVPGFKHMKYRNKHLRHWDGKLRLFESRFSRIYAGLTAKILEFAEERDYTVDDQSGITIEAEFSLVEAKEFVESLQLPFEIKEERMYQIEAFAKAVRRRRCVLVSPTASGKSLIAYLITRYHNRKTLIVVPTTSLVEQMTKDFEEYGYDKKIHKVMAGVVKHTDLDITITTWQSVYEQPAAFFGNFEVIIGDEAHNFKAKSLTSIMTKTKHTPYKIGMTGTLDGALVHELVLTGLFGPVERVVRTKDLMDKKVIAELKIKILLLKHKPKAFASYQDEMEYIVMASMRNKFIRNLAVSLKGNTLVLFAYVEKHGKVLYELIKEKRQDVYFCSGQTETELREEIRAIVEKSDNAIIVASYGVFSTGVNIKRLNNIIFASPTKSRIRTLQSIGRGLRMGDGKDSCTLFDIADDISTPKKRNFTLNHMVERVKMYNSEGFNYDIHTIDI